MQSLVHSCYVILFFPLLSVMMTETRAWSPSIPSTMTGVVQFLLPASQIRLSMIQQAAGDDGFKEELSLMEMDVVIYSETQVENGKPKLGAVQEDGRITPLCTWTSEPAFDEFMELLVDEEDLLPGFRVEDGSIRIHSIVPENLLSYGSRQVNGGMGLGNPHGEESELLYYIHQSVVEGVELEVRPNLEVFW